MVIYANEVETNEKKKLPEIKQLTTTSRKDSLTMTTQRAWASILASK